MRRPTWSCRAAAPERSRSCVWCKAARPVLFVPSPNVAEDHQDEERPGAGGQGGCGGGARCRGPHARAMARAMELLANGEALRRMSENLEKLARPDAAERIVDEIEKVMK